MNGIGEKEVTIIPVGDEGGRLSSLQTGRVHAVIISGIHRLTATRMGFRQVRDDSKLPIEVSGSTILAGRSYLLKYPNITLRFLKAWIEARYFFKANAEFSIGVLKKYVATHDAASRAPFVKAYALRRKIHDVSLVPHQDGHSRRQSGRLRRVTLH